MGRDEAMIVAGLGFRHGVSSDEIVELVGRALKEASLSLDDLNALATLDARADEPAFADAARQLNVPCATVDPETLRHAGPRVKTHSVRIMALHGVGSIAEAAALGHAGPDGDLILRRIASSRVTCALARGY
jgi:cobalt-precorrin 5A hydrolase